MKKVTSFDIFDTIVARRVDKPTDIFDIVEVETKFEHYKQKRIMAETLSNNGNIYDIYNKFKELTGINDETKNALMNIEIDTEKKIFF